MNKTIINKDCTITRIGTIADNDGTLLESAVELSEKNFRLLLKSIPKQDKRLMLLNDIKIIKDSLTEFTFDASKTREDLVKLLNEALEYQVFITDINEFDKPDIKVVGKIDLSKFNEV